MFVISYLQCGIVFADDVWPRGCDKHSLSLLSEEAMQMCSASVLDASYKKYRASDVACAIIYVLRRKFKVRPLWRGELEELTLNALDTPETQEILSLLDAQLKTIAGDRENVAPSNNGVITPSGKSPAFSISPDGVAMV